MTVTKTRDGRKRSIAWIYYALLSALSVVAAVAVAPAALIPAALLGLYSVYLFRGGRFVIWLW